VRTGVSSRGLGRGFGVGYFVSSKQHFTLYEADGGTHNSFETGSWQWPSHGDPGE
jgi:hypothetical protein